MHFEWIGQLKEDLGRADAQGGAGVPGGALVPLVLHVPHARSAMPTEVLAEFVVDAAELATHQLRSVDHFTDELFGADFAACMRVEFPICRLAVDPERFEVDEHEPMAARGLGVLYERGHDGSVIRTPVTGARRQELLDRWYRPHHARLAEAVAQGIDARGRVLIVDCHSFPAEPLAVDHDRRVPRPDLCIGTAGIHTPAALVDAAQACCWRWGFSVEVDAPYAGAVVPIDRLGTDPRVQSVMVEVNRALYMRVEGGNAVKTDGFWRMRAFLTELVDALRDAAAPSKEVSR